MKFNPTLHRLSNGMPVILDPMNIATATMTVAFNVGARDEQPHNAGITHFMEHMLMAGTTDRPTSKSMYEFVENNGGAISAWTNNNRMWLEGRIIAENLDVLAEVMADNIKNPLFDTTTIENEKSVILDEYALWQDSPDRQFYKFSATNIFQGSSFANITLGNPDTIKSFTRNQLLDWKDAKLSASNSAIVISGKITRLSKLLTRLEGQFGWLPAREIQGSHAIEFNECAAHAQYDINNTRLKIAIKDLAPAGLEHRFQDMCIGRFKPAFNKRLFDIIRAKHGLVYDINTGYFGTGFCGANTINTGMSPENAQQLVKLAAGVAADMTSKNLYNEKELNEFNNRARLGNAEWIESAEKRKNTLLNFYTNYGKLYNLDETHWIANKITVADVIENTNDIFDAPISVITQGAKVDPEMLRQIWIENCR